MEHIWLPYMINPGSLTLKSEKKRKKKKKKNYNYLKGALNGLRMEQMSTGKRAPAQKKPSNLTHRV